MRKSAFKWLSLCAVVVVVSVFALTPCASAKTKLILGTSVEPGYNYAHQTCVKFKEQVEKYSNGEIEVEIYPASQLGDEQELVRSMQMGTVHASFPAINNYNVFAPSLGYYTLPYVFKDEEEFRKLTDIMWDQNNEWSIKEANIRFLSIVEIGFRHLTNSKHPVKTIDDLKGLKIRVPQNTIMVNAFKSFGVEPIAMAFAEVFNALQQGVLDGQEASYNIVTAKKYQEVQKYATDIAYNVHAGCLIIAEPYFQGLSKELQDAVTKAGKDAMMFERGFSDDMKKKDLEIMKAAGMQLQGPPTDMAEWVKRGRSTWPAAMTVIGGGDAAKGKAVIDVVEAARGKIK